jgi:hypothetical protein
MNYTEQQIEPHPDEAFANAVWDALKGDHSDLRKQAIILEAHRTTPAPITTEQSSEIADIERARQIFEDASEAYDRELHEPGLTGMSPELNAAHVILKALRQPPSDAIRNAVIEECAKVAEQWNDNSPYNSRAQAIRALTQGKPDHV